jgi:hypothetical protein
MKLKIFLLSLFVLTLASCKQHKKPEISKIELEGHLKYLASPDLKGRYPGSEGGKMAAEYIAQELELAGAKLLNKNGFQHFNVVTGNKTGKNNKLIFNDKKYQFEKDFVPFAFSDSGKYEGELVFAGYGFDIRNKKFHWNSYKETDVKNKWVIILRDSPEIKALKKFTIQSKDDRSKALKARDKGARGVLFVSPATNKKKLTDPTRKKGNAGIPVLHISRETANDLLNNTNHSLEKLEKNILEKKSPNPLMLDGKLLANIDISPNRVTTQNVVGELKAKNSENKPYIIIGGHYDHLGMGGHDTGSRRPDTTAIHYGADDNGSGIAAMIEIAEKLGTKKDSLKANFLFIAFGAEEMGLIGSKYFTSHPTVNLKKVSAMINIDMIGRLRDENSLQVGGVGTSLQAEEILKKINRDFQFTLGMTKEGYGPSDHSSFYSKDVPVFFFSTGPHLDYHTPEDTPDKINYEGLKKVTRYIYSLSNQLSGLDSSLTFQEAGPKNTKDQYKHGEKLKVTLGIMPDFAGIEERGLRADMVIKGKPASRAGMKNGDIITALNGKKIKDIYDYMERLSDINPGQTITVEIIRDNKEKVLMVQL